MNKLSTFFPQSSHGRHQTTVVTRKLENVQKFTILVSGFWAFQRSKIDPSGLKCTSDHRRSEVGSKCRSCDASSSPMRAKTKNATQHTVQTTCFDAGSQEVCEILCPMVSNNCKVTIRLLFGFAGAATEERGPPLSSKPIIASFDQSTTGRPRRWCENFRAEQ